MVYHETDFFQRLVSRRIQKLILSCVHKGNRSVGWGDGEAKHGFLTRFTDVTARGNSIPASLPSCRADGEKGER